jgi:hypothetical protein
VSNKWSFGSAVNGATALRMRLNDAAPDMYEALQRIVDAHDAPAMIEIALAALAKIEIGD